MTEDKMTNSSTTAPNEGDNSVAKSPKSQTGVGYGRPPKHGQFRKNQSGNPMGRKPGSKNVLPHIWEVYNRPTKIRGGNGKTRSVPAIVALHEMHMLRGLQGDVRSAVIAFRFAAELGLYDLPEPQVVRHEFGFTREQMREMSTEMLQELIDVTGKAQDFLDQQKLPKPG